MKFLKFAKKSAYVLQIGDREKLAFLIRILSVLFVPLYIWSVFDVRLYWLNYPPTYPFEFLVIACGQGVMIYGGLFFITTPAAKKYKIAATFCYLPAAFVSPILVGMRLGYIGTAILSLGFLFTYIRLNPWKGGGTHTLQTVGCKRLAVFVRITAVVFALLYVWSLYAGLFDFGRFVKLRVLGEIVSLKTDWYDYNNFSWKDIVRFLILGISANAGMFFITTHAARRFKILATIIYIPSVLVTPCIFGVWIPSYACFALLCIFPIVIYDSFNPWMR